MENKNQKKCSIKKHENIDSTIFCPECQVYMCNKCENYHSELFQNHHKFKLDKDIEQIFTGFCKVENHAQKLEFFCKDHLQLCCVACISKLKGKGYGQHTDCDICFIEDIKEEKKSQLVENIKYLENLSKTFDDSINQIKKIFDEINKNKEKLKLEIQKTFTNIRNALNEREDKLLLEVDKTYDELYFSEDLVIKSEKLPKKAKLSLETGKQINKEWNDKDKLSLFINDCLDIEMNIKDINSINENIEKTKIINIEVFFTPSNIDNEQLFKNIKDFGKINCNKKIDKKKEYDIVMKELEKKGNELKERLEKKLKIKTKANEILQKEENDYLLIKNELEKHESFKIEEQKRLKNLTKPQPQINQNTISNEIFKKLFKNP